MAAAFQRTVEDLEKINVYFLHYVMALLIELIVFFGFVYIASSKTKGEVSRRWKASALISVLYGLVTHFLLMIIIFLGWIFETDFETMFVYLPEKLLSSASQCISLATTITMPAIIIGVFIVYHYLWQTGDRVVERYWKNPKIHYDENQKPPYFKF